MSQWLPIGQLPNDAIELVTRTFVAVFPYSLLFEGAGQHLILLGSRSHQSVLSNCPNASTNPPGLGPISCGSVSQLPTR